jgi:hypothetical protein
MLDRNQLVVGSSRGEIRGSSLHESLVNVETKEWPLPRYLEFVAERLLIEKDPRIVIFHIPMIL